MRRERVGVLCSSRQTRHSRNRWEEAYLALTISRASSKFSTGIIGRMGPNISLRPNFRMANTHRGGSTHSAISESSGVTPRTTVGAMYLVDESVSPPETIVPSVLSNNPLTRAKCASVGARTKDPFSGPSGKNSEILIRCQLSWLGYNEPHSRRTSPS